MFGSCLAKSRVSLTTRQVNLSGSFFDTGVKKLATAFSVQRYGKSALLPYHMYSLVVVDSNLRFFRGGGDSDRALSLRSCMGENGITGVGQISSLEKKGCVSWSTWSVTPSFGPLRATPN